MNIMSSKRQEQTSMYLIYHSMSVFLSLSLLSFMIIITLQISLCIYTWILILHIYIGISRSQDLLCEDTYHLSCTAEGSRGHVTQDAYQGKAQRHVCNV